MTLVQNSPSRGDSFSQLSRLKTTGEGRGGGGGGGTVVVVRFTEEVVSRESIMFQFVYEGTHTCIISYDVPGIGVVAVCTLVYDSRYITYIHA